MAVTAVAAAAMAAIIVGATGGALAQRQAGRQAQREAKIQAEQEEIAAIAREAERKSRLADALASQNVSAGARGVMAFEGSPLAMLQTDIEREERATQRDKAFTRLQAISIRARGRFAKQQAEAGAFFGLLRMGGQAVLASGAGGGGG